MVFVMFGMMNNHTAVHLNVNNLESQPSGCEWWYANCSIGCLIQLLFRLDAFASFLLLPQSA